MSYSDRQAFEQNKPQELKADIWMISGCDDHQTSADVSKVQAFQLPDADGLAGGACTATLLNVLYETEENPSVDYSFTTILDKMRGILKKKGFRQIPQLSSTQPIDLNKTFKIVPDDLPGTRRAVLIGINYKGQKGELRGCHNDAFNMYNYIQDYYGFQDEDISVLADDGDHPLPTRAAIVQAYQQVVRQSKAGDAIFLHYSGHGTKVKDLNGDEDDGYDEALVPLDFKQSGMILDDELYEIIVKGLPAGVHVVSLMDCCHSGTVLDLPYIYKANGQFQQMELDKGFNISGMMGKLKLGKKLMNGKMGNQLLKMGKGPVGGLVKQFLR